jgi:uncharacterized protein
MGWIQTYTGKRFDPSTPQPADFDIRDIAHALSLQCRFNGHCLQFYSVADHSVRVSLICSPTLALWGLLHDMAEAYVGDLPRPVKASLPSFIAIEDRVLKIACEVFRRSWPMPPEVKVADDILLATEARDLMSAPPQAWPLRQTALADRICPLSPSEAEQAFLVRFATLFPGGARLLLRGENSQ